MRLFGLEGVATTRGSESCHYAVFHESVIYMAASTVMKFGFHFLGRTGTGIKN